MNEVGVEQLKDKHRATWAAGDYAEVADELVLELGAIAVERAGIAAGMRVVDVATGSGNAAIPAALRGATVTGLDLVPELLDTARRRAAEAGVEVEWVVGDAEELPFPDRSFDAVLSTLGVQFAPRHGLAAREVARVCKPGGVIVLCNWTPAGFIGRFLSTVAPYLPPPPDYASPPPLWGDEKHVEELFAGLDVKLEFEPRTVTFEHESPTGFIEFMANRYGPLVTAREAVAPEGRWEELRRELIALGEEASDVPDGFRVASEYLLVTGRKATE
jgi:ubiquinone/menaquinone biosynthesis C-methylase UbiE